MRVRHWIAWGLLVFVVLAIGGVAFGFSQAGYTKFVVETGSMVPEIYPGDLVIDAPPGKSADDYAVGDVITFKHGQGNDLVTHRITEITPEGIKTKGDANRTADVWTIPLDFVVGKVAFTIPKGGYVVIFLGQPAGIAAIVVAVVGLILLWRIFFPTDRPADAATTDATPAVGRHAGPAADDAAVGTVAAAGVGLEPDDAGSMSISDGRPPDPAAAAEPAPTD